jgi:hypothetical protein
MMQPQPKAVEEKKLGLERYGLEDGSYQPFTDIRGQVLALNSSTSKLSFILGAQGKPRRSGARTILEGKSR